MIEILIICVIGGIAGWIAGLLVKSENDSVFVDIIFGIVGGYIGYRIFGSRLNITENIWVNKTITATAGALILSLIIKFVRRILAPRASASNSRSNRYN